MKNTFAVSMTLLLAFTLIGSVVGYKKATTPHHTESHTEAAATEAPTTEGATGEAPAETAAPAAAATGNEPEATAAAAEAQTPAGDATLGKEKFASATCGGCHGPNAEGGVGPALNVTKDWTDEQFALAVREGKAPTKTLGAMMPHFTATQVSDADIANIHAYLKTLN